MSTMTRRLDKLEQLNTPAVRPLLILSLHEAGREGSEPLSVDGLPFNREPGEAWDAYKARAVMWHAHNSGDSHVVVMKVHYRGDNQ